MILRRYSGEGETEDAGYISRAEYRLLYSWGEAAFADDPSFFRPILETAAFQRALEHLGSCTIDLMRTTSGYTLRVLVALCSETAELPEEIVA